MIKPKTASFFCAVIDECVHIVHSSTLVKHPAAVLTLLFSEQLCFNVLLVYNVFDYIILIGS